jgi:hypothetical protein
MNERSKSFFLVRIELHAAKEPDDYEVLHAAMEKTGFTRRINHKGRTLHLPTAEYAIRSDESTAGLLENAKAAATTTKKSFCAVIVKSAEFEEYNLTEKATA